MIKAIIFDLWETLGTKNVGVSKLLQEKFDIPKTDDYIRKYEEAVQLEPWETENQMAKNFLSKFGVEQSLENIEFVVNVFKQGIIKATLFGGMRELLVSLKQKGLKLGLLSNTTIFESVVLENLEIRDLFDAIVFSWHKGNLKPSPEAFKHILGELGVSEEEALFVDDGKKNIESAKALGIQAILFEDVETLKKHIGELGV